MAQTISKTDYTFDINETVDGIDYFYYFNKGKNDTFINLKVMTFNINQPTKTLCKEVAVLEKFYNIAAKEVKIDLWNMNVGNPFDYEDILANQINTFANDSIWQSYYKTASANFKNKNFELDYDLISKIMTDKKVYACLETELNKIGYTISQVGIEKVALLDLKYFPDKKQKLLKQFPYTEAQFKTIPVPYIVYIGINKFQ